MFGFPHSKDVKYYSQNELNRLRDAAVLEEHERMQSRIDADQRQHDLMISAAQHSVSVSENISASLQVENERLQKSLDEMKHRYEVALTRIRSDESLREEMIALLMGDRDEA